MPCQSPLLIVIPAFKESERLPKFLQGLAEEVSLHFSSAAILVVDDGSEEGEQARLRDRIAPICAKHATILPTIYLPKNIGKGGAILKGWDQYAINFHYLAFIDADGAISPKEFCRLASMLNPDENETALFASRIRMLGRKVSRTGLRHFSGRFFAAIVGILIEPEIYDSQCGLKFIPSHVFGKIRPFLKGHRFAFDVELLAGLQVAGCPIREVPIDWTDITGSKVSFFRDTTRMVRSVLQIKLQKKKWTL